ncbi:hypothetical protein EBU99_14350, partial [bacterium]|nr:hypothetical protein [bacterium]
MVLIELDNSEVTDEYILYNHNSMKLQIQKALDVIKEYIINNNLLIVGGTAIDYALKVKNDNLYNDLYQVPDFDIISPNNVEHANNIGEILCNLEYKDISIVPAVHHTTVRVQLLAFTLFDSTYIPDYIYNKIPYLEYKEFKFIDPSFQKINQYLSLSLLFKITGPSYNILNRFTKDVQRLDLLNNYYIVSPINDLINLPTSSFSINYNLSNIENIKILDNENKEHIFKHLSDIKSKFINKYHINSNISYSIQTNFIFHGVLAYHLLYSEFDRIYSKLYSILPLTNEDKNYIKSHYNNITIHKNYNINGNNIIFDLYQNTDLCFINTNNIDSNNSIDEFLNKLKSIYSNIKYKKMENIIDLRPKHVDGNFTFDKQDFTFKIFDLYGDLLGINLIYIHTINKYLPISTYTYNLMYFLTNYYLEENEIIKNINLHYYVSLYSIINIIQYMYYKYPDQYNKSENFTHSCFNYSINISESKNYPDNYYYYLLNFKNLVTNNKNLDLLPPKN